VRPGLSDIRIGLAETLLANLGDVQIVSHPSAVRVLPSILVMPSESDFFVSMSRGTDTYRLDLYALVARRTEASQLDLDDYVDGVGARSIRAIIFDNPTLGLDGVNASVARMSDYGGVLDLVGEDHWAARLELVVHVSGAAE
jgi:hypothetical protein